jgi:hypothetical protein
MGGPEVESIIGTQVQDRQPSGSTLQVWAPQPQNVAVVGQLARTLEPLNSSADPSGLVAHPAVKVVTKSTQKLKTRCCGVNLGILRPYFRRESLAIQAKNAVRRPMARRSLTPIGLPSITFPV